MLIYQALYVTWYEKIGLMCTQKLTTFWTLKFHNSVVKCNLSINLLQLLKHTMENFMQFTELVYLTNKVRYIE